MRAMPFPVVSIITATYQRPKDLWRLLECVQLIELQGMRIEHLIIHDGPEASRVCCADQLWVV